MSKVGRVLKRSPATSRGKSGRPTIYPWPKWTDGQWWEIEPAAMGKSFDTIRQSIYQHANRNGRKAQVVKNSESTLAFQFYDE
jgi:hypothetical protein